MSQPAVPSTTPQPVQDNEPLEQGNILIAYFSLWDNAPWEQEGVNTSTSASVVVDESGASGTTRYVAQMIQNAVGVQRLGMDTPLDAARSTVQSWLDRLEY